MFKVNDLLKKMSFKKVTYFVSINFCLFTMLFVFQNCADSLVGYEFTSKVSLETVIPHCKDITAQNFNPKLTHAYTVFEDEPDYDQVMSSPVVGDLNNDGFPEIAFTTFNKDGKYQFDGVLRVIDGRTKKIYLSIAGGSLSPKGAFSPLLIDIDGDGFGEIVYISHDNQTIIALNHTGTVRWQQSMTRAATCYTGLAAADIDGDGKAEIIGRGDVIFENRLSSGNFETRVETYNASPTGCTFFASNLNSSDRGLPIISSDGVYEYVDGRFVERFKLCTGCYISVADLNPNHPGKELVATGAGVFRIFNSDGKIISDKNLTEHYAEDRCMRNTNGVETFHVGGGAATIGNFDSDSTTMEIAIATGKSLTVFDWQGTKLAGSRTTDCSSLSTGLTSFDFNGDGLPEILYGDEKHFRVYTVTPGQENLNVIWEIENTSGTLQEYPVVADLNRDWSPEIIVVSNNYQYKNLSGNNGLRIFSVAEGQGLWMPTRDIWNQHQYMISNVTDRLRATASTGFSGAISKNFRRNLPSNEELSCRIQ